MLGITSVVECAPVGDNSKELLMNLECCLTSEYDSSFYCTGTTTDNAGSTCTGMCLADEYLLPACNTACSRCIDGTTFCNLCSAGYFQHSDQGCFSLCFCYFYSRFEVARLWTQIVSLVLLSSSVILVTRDFTLLVLVVSVSSEVCFLTVRL